MTKWLLLGWEALKFGYKHRRNAAKLLGLAKETAKPSAPWSYKDTAHVQQQIKQATTCDRPQPPGWRCTRGPHTGPCALVRAIH